MIRLKVYPNKELGFNIKISSSRWYIFSFYSALIFILRETKICKNVIKIGK